MRLIALTAAAFVALVVCGRPAAAVDPAIVSLYPADHPRGVLVTSGGWVYCLQVQDLAARLHYSLLCGRYYRDGFTGYGKRSKRMLDWGDPTYLASLAAKAGALHRRVGGELVLLGVSYSGFGVATLASHHPELRPDRLIVVDSFLDLVARRAAAGRSATGTEIDTVTGGTTAALRARSVSVPGLAALVRHGTELTVVWSIAPGERREFNGATCDRNANAGVMAQVASAVGRFVAGWVTLDKHGHDLWDSGRRIMARKPPGRRVLFRPGRGIPRGATC